MMKQKTIGDVVIQKRWLLGLKWASEPVALELQNARAPTQVAVAVAAVVAAEAVVAQELGVATMQDLIHQVVVVVEQMGKNYIGRQPGEEPADDRSEGPRGRLASNPPNLIEPTEMKYLNVEGQGLRTVGQRTGAELGRRSSRDPHLRQERTTHFRRRPHQGQFRNGTTYSARLETQYTEYKLSKKMLSRGDQWFPSEKRPTGLSAGRKQVVAKKDEMRGKKVFSRGNLRSCI
jgi:hypothetical protein